MIPNVKALRRLRSEADDVRRHAPLRAPKSPGSVCEAPGRVIADLAAILVQVIDVLTEDA